MPNPTQPMNEEELSKECGKYLHNRRILLGIDQATIANKAKISRATYSTIERGDRLPRLDTFIRLCQIMYISPSKFIDDWEGDL